jgi:hypothetical protein
MKNAELAFFFDNARFITDFTALEPQSQPAAKMAKDSRKRV